MAKEQKMTMLPDDTFQDNGLTRIHPDTKFVIEHKTGLILFIFKKQERNAMIQRLLDDKVVKTVADLKENAYQDLLVMS